MYTLQYRYCHFQCIKKQASLKPYNNIHLEESNEMCLLNRDCYCLLRYTAPRVLMKDTE